MTTIATDGKTIAADTLAVGRWKDSKRVQKVHSINGCLVGGAGELVEILRFKDWFEAGCPEDNKPDLEDSFSALVLYPDGTAKACYHKLYFYDVGLPYAIGSGAEYAMGAMVAGATPEEAVIVASMLDNNTNDDVIVMGFEDREEVVQYSAAVVLSGDAPDQPGDETE